MTALLRSRAGWGLYLRWVFANALGEMFGLGLTFVLGIGLAQLIGEPQGFGVALGLGLLMAASGAIEGVVVGTMQWWAMQPALPQIDRKSWVAATLLGALVAWTFAAIPTMMISVNNDPVLSSAAEPETTWILLMSGLVGALLGIVLALAQWIVLRRHVRYAWWWLPANGAAWLVGMPVIFAAVDLAQAAADPSMALVIFVGALALTGAIVGAVHGIALIKLASQEVQ